MHPQTALIFAEEVRRGLTSNVQKTLPTKYLYDDVGSALFDAITALPEYGLTRADLRLLRTHAASIGQLCPDTVAIAELGSGSGSKTCALMEGFPPGVVYRPIDLSPTALEKCRRDCGDFPVEPIEADFLAGLSIAAEARNGGQLLVGFLGSNIGNFARDAIVPFLRAIRDHLQTGDSLLIGADLIKPVDLLLLAYGDPAGVTAAFNRNLLSRINRQLDGNFSVSSYLHEARWNAAERRMEAHLGASTDQNVTLRAIDLNVTIRANETIWTESSHKFEPAELIDMARQAQFSHLETWTDAEWPFAELLFRV